MYVGWEGRALLNYISCIVNWLEIHYTLYRVLARSTVITYMKCKGHIVPGEQVGRQNFVTKVRIP